VICVAGGLPSDAFEWLRINSLEIVGMDRPRTFKAEVRERKEEKAGPLIGYGCQALPWL